MIAEVLDHFARTNTTLYKISGLAFFAVAVFSELVAYPYGQRADKLSQDRIHQDELIIARSNKDASHAIATATRAEEDLSKAYDHAEKAHIQAAKAEERAAEASQRVDEAHL